MLLLTNDEVAQVLTVERCIEVLRRFYASEPERTVLSRFRTEGWVAGATPGQFYDCKTMEGSAAAAPRYVIRVDSAVKREVGSEAFRVQRAALAGGRGWTGMFLVFDTETGCLLAILPTGLIERMRVGALYAVAADRLARSESASVALVGSGWHAGGTLSGLASVRQLRSVRVWSPTAANRERFARENAAALGVAVEAAPDGRTAVAGADIVALATNAGQPVIDADWLEPGQHVQSIRPAELDPNAYQRADVVVVNRRSTWIMHFAAGGQFPRELGGRELPEPPEGRAVEVADFFAGRAGRRRPEDITVFPNEASNHLLAAQCAAVSCFVLDEAAALGLGRDLPAEWFVQDMHP